MAKSWHNCIVVLRRRKYSKRCINSRKFRSENWFINRLSLLLTAIDQTMHYRFDNPWSLLMQGLEEPSGRRQEINAHDSVKYCTVQWMCGRRRKRETDWVQTKEIYPPPLWGRHNSRSFTRFLPLLHGAVWLRLLVTHVHSIKPMGSILRSDVQR